MARTDNLKNYLTDLANSIKSKKGDSSPILASNFDTEIENLPSGGDTIIHPEHVSFYGYPKTTIDLSWLRTEKMTSMGYMFYNCKAIDLDLSKFDTSNVANMLYMFYGNNNLKNLDLSKFNTSNVTNMNYMFCGCKEIEELDLRVFNISKVSSIRSMFENTTKMHTLNLNGLNAGGITTVLSLFANASSLENLQFFDNLGKAYTQKSVNYSNYKLDLSACKKLTHDSLMDVINKLYDLNLSYNVAGGGTLYTQSLVLGDTNLAKLTEEEIAIATAKGWTVS